MPAEVAPAAPVAAAPPPAPIEPSPEANAPETGDPSPSEPQAPPEIASTVTRQPAAIRVVADDPTALWSFTRVGCDYLPGQTPAVVVATTFGGRQALFNASCLSVVSPDQLGVCVCVRPAFFQDLQGATGVPVRGAAIDLILERFAAFARTLKAVSGEPSDERPAVTLVGLYLSPQELERLRTSTAGSLITEGTGDDGTTVLEIPLPAEAWFRSTPPSLPATRTENGSDVPDRAVP
jgi:hypothetical protein